MDNRIGEVDPFERTGLLFSGGVDSMHSLLTNLDLKPRLVMLWGSDDRPYPENAVQWEYIISTYSQFAGKLGLEFNTIKTNVSIILDDQRISHDFHSFLYDGRFRFRMLHSFVLIPLTAPLSMGRFNYLIFSGGGPRRPDDNSIPEATLPEIDEKMIWADLKVKHLAPVSRQEKISGAIKEYLEKDNLKLKVCTHKSYRAKLNDSTCEKCIKTIASLVLAGIDPNICGFDVDETTFQRLKEYVVNDLHRSRFYPLDVWIRFQKSLPEQIEDDMYGSKEFFDWFKTIDLYSKEKNVYA